MNADTTPRWWNRLAAWICEALHDLAAPAWKADVDDDEAWDQAQREQDEMQGIYERGFDDGGHAAWEEARDYFGERYD